MFLNWLITLKAFKGKVNTCSGFSTFYSSHHEEKLYKCSNYS